MQLGHPVVLLGVPFHPVTLEGCAEWIAQRIREKRPGYLATANLDFAAQASRDVELQEILLQADCVVCDGMPLVWASRWVDAPLPERVAGSDLVWKLFERGAQEGWRIYFLGATEDTLARLEETLHRDYPGLVIAGWHAPPFGSIHDLDNDVIASDIYHAHPDILLVAMGCPKQEKWISMFHRSTGVPLSIGVGASLDFVVGRVRRAPGWMQKSGLEWFFRLLQEPGRMFRRYFIDLLYFVFSVRRQKRALRKFRRPPGEASFGFVRAPRKCMTEATYLHGPLNAAAVEAATVPEVRPTPVAPNAIYDCSDVSFVDSTGLGFLARMHKKCAALGGALVLYQPPKNLVTLLRSVHMDRVIQMAHTREELDILFPREEAATVPEMHEDGVLDMKVHQDLRAAGADQVFWDVCAEWESFTSATHLRLDLEDVTFMDSTGLSCLLRLYKMVTLRDGGSMSVCGVRENVRNVITVAKLESVLVMEE